MLAVAGSWATGHIERITPDPEPVGVNGAPTTSDHSDPGDTACRGFGSYVLVASRTLTVSQQTVRMSPVAKSAI
jgi:hypothetical protein